MSASETASALEKLRYQERRAWNEYYTTSNRASAAWDRYYALARQLREAEATVRAEAS